MGKLSTHVPDAVNGMPAAGVRAHRYGLEYDQRIARKTVRTDADGRTDESPLPADALVAGTYALGCYVARHIARIGVAQGHPALPDGVAPRFTIADPNPNDHVPLPGTPWSYSTHRGS